MTPDPLPHEFARFAGEMAESLSFNRSLGQIYGLLYVSSRPLSLEEIASQLAMSKGNASINVRLLESWGAVRPAWISGSRRDHYEAERNIKAIVLRRVQEGLNKRIATAEARLEAFSGAGNGGDDRFARDRVKEIQKLLNSARRALKLLPKIAALIG